MFVEIDVARAREHISIKDLASRAGIKYNTLLAKLNGKSEFTRNEMLKVQRAFSTKIPLEQLFRTENKSA